MSRTYVYLLVLIGVYLLIVKGIKMDSGRSTTHTSNSGRVHGGGGGTFE